MAQAKIYWDMENYYQVEKIFRKSVEFSSEHDVWKLNVAHVLFMQVSITAHDFASLHYHIQLCTRSQNLKKLPVSMSPL